MSAPGAAVGLGDPECRQLQLPAGVEGGLGEGRVTVGGRGVGGDPVLGELPQRVAELAVGVGQGEGVLHTPKLPTGSRGRRHRAADRAESLKTGPERRRCNRCPGTARCRRPARRRGDADYERQAAGTRMVAGQRRDVAPAGTAPLGCRPSAGRTVAEVVRECRRPGPARTTVARSSRAPTQGPPGPARPTAGPRPARCTPTCSSRPWPGPPWPTPSRSTTPTARPRRRSTPRRLGPAVRARRCWPRSSAGTPAEVGAFTGASAKKRWRLPPLIPADRSAGRRSLVHPIPDHLVTGTSD